MFRSAMARNSRKVAGKCFYRSYLEEEFSWIKPAPNDRTSFICTICNSNRTISMSNMGKTAILSHEKSARHINAIKMKKNVPSIESVLSRTNSQIEKSTSNEKTPLNVDILNPTEKKEAIGLSRFTSSVEPNIAKNAKVELKSYLTNDAVTEAEILWLLHSSYRHFSTRDIETSVPIICRMFKDSELAKKLQLSKSKASYVTVYGIAHYFQQQILSSINSCDKIVIGFDESINQLNKKQQMDFSFRFWNNDANEVNTRYYTSAFLGHCKAADLIRAFSDNIPNEMMNKVIQISMDGPNVNVKFHKDIEENIIKPEHNKSLINIGTCGLHVVHNAFKKCFQQSQWKVDEFLKGLFYLFEYSPSRREDYVNAGKVNIFPLHFTNVRWVENASVAQRARKIIPAVTNYIHSVSNTSSEPSCKSYITVKTLICDELIQAKLAFFEWLAEELEPFLKGYQSNDPKAAFLFSDLSALFLNLLERFVKSEVINKYNKKLLQINLNDDKNLKIADNIKLDIGTKLALKEVKSISNKILFKTQCRTILKDFVIKLLEKSPLKYSFVKGISCLNPDITLQQKLAETRLISALEYLAEKNIFSTSTCNKIASEFQQLTFLTATKEKLKTFDRKEIRLDHFWISLLEVYGFDKYKNLLDFIKIVMTLSHGNAFMERGFSINKDCVVENQKEKSLIAQRVICDAIDAMNYPLHEFVVDKELIKCARLSNKLYKDELEKEKAKREKEQDNKRNKKIIAIELKELEDKKQKILESAKKQAAKIEEEIYELKKS